MAERLLGNIKGKDGSPATVSFVEPVSLPSGSKPTLENLGSNTNAVLRFGIPAGSQGAPGASVIGPRGEQGLPGTDGAPGRAATINVHGTTLVDDEADVKVMNMGSENNASLHFYLKRPPEEITIDEELIENSTNPVQSKAIQEALDLKADSSSIPTKVSDLTNDRSFVSETSVNVMIEDAVEAAVTAANPIDTALSNESNRPVQNKAITSALGEKATMTVEDALDNTQTKYGEIVTLSNADREVSIVLTGENIESVVLSQSFAERIPTIVSELPTEGSLDRLYLVPASGDNYSMHIWMEVDGIEKWVGINNAEVNSGSVYDLYRCVNIQQAYYNRHENIQQDYGILQLSILNNNIIGYRITGYFNAGANIAVGYFYIAANINLNNYGENITISQNLNKAPYSIDFDYNQDYIKYLKVEMSTTPPFVIYLYHDSNVNELVVQNRTYFDLRAGTFL